MDELFNFRLDLDIDIEINDTYNCRYFLPKKVKSIPEQYLKYKNAERLASDLKIEKGFRAFIFVDGSFYFGDLFESFIVKNDYHVKKMTIQTLSMNQNNIDSLANLINGNYIEKLDLIISDYFFSHERNDLVRYIYEKLDVESIDFQLSVAGTHCKICTIETFCDKFIVMHGSANLRSSSNIEQLVIEENENLFKFVEEINQNIVSEYKTINKSIRRNKLWQQVVKAEEEINKQDPNGGQLLL